MADQPEALRLADWLDNYRTTPVDAQAAAELRRLHDIEKAYESACGIIAEQDKKLAELEAVNAELLGALCALVLNIDAGGATLGAMYDARAAIAKAEGQT